MQGHWQSTRSVLRFSRAPHLSDGGSAYLGAQSGSACFYGESGFVDGDVKLRSRSGGMMEFIQLWQEADVEGVTEFVEGWEGDVVDMSVVRLVSSEG